MRSKKVICFHAKHGETTIRIQGLTGSEIENENNKKGREWERIDKRSKIFNVQED